ncbi:30S ribosomal protein S7 [bacterium]|nr:30S ribosomal protein S7 [bacterium]MBU1754214.1 30S ribosomal protein S7 [bacterium]
MPRKGPARKRPVLPDPIFNSQMVTRFVNVIMKKGKKSLAQGIVYDAFEIIQNKTKNSPLAVFKQALNNARPHVAVKSRRVGGATYQVPIEVEEERGMALAMRWIIGFATQQAGKPMREKLSQEIMNAANGTGSAIKKRDDTHKMAEANKAFAHYKW